MDSMRSLNSSLPSSRSMPPEQLLQAFRTAALSVTNLYKSAVTDQQNSRQAGYQDALEDLLSFLDRENLGLQDGEGWRVRQWATQRYDTSHHSSNETESPRETLRTQSVTPAQEEQVDHATQTLPQQPDPSPEAEPAQSERPEMFRFAGSNETNEDMQTDNTISEPNSSSTSSATHPIRVEVVNRNSRSPQRNPLSRQNSRNQNKEFTFSAGSKRKLQFPEFFDISSVGPSRDGGGAPKRGRHA